MNRREILKQIEERLQEVGVDISNYKVYHFLPWAKGRFEIYMRYENIFLDIFVSTSDNNIVDMSWNLGNVEITIPSLDKSFQELLDESYHEVEVTLSLPVIKNEGRINENSD